MSRHPARYQWSDERAHPFDARPTVLVTLLALGSLGMIRARCCGLDSVACHRGRLLPQADHTVRQRRRAFYQEAGAKAGAKRGCQRRACAVADCFVPLRRWVLSFGSCQRRALALDVTNRGARFPGRCVRVLAGGSGIPVAGKILPANPKDAWPPPGVLCCRSCSRRYRPTGWWWCGPTAVWSRRGCVGKSRRSAGSRCGVPRPAARSVPTAGCAGTPSQRWYRASVAVWPPPGRPTRPQPNRWSARGGASGTPATTNRGCCGRTGRRRRPRRAGRRSGPGSSKVAK